MATAVEISRRDMHEFLAAQGFQEIQVAGTKERVYSKFVDTGLCLRVYTSVEGESSRGVGEDAIRTVLVTKVNGAVKIVGGDKRVHRVEGWRANLQNRLDRWREQLGPACPKCRAATVRKRSRRGPFWGCCRYPDCRTVQPIQTPIKAVRPGERGGEHEEAALARRERAEPVQDEWDQRMRDKAAYAAAEREAEEAAYRSEMEAELRANGIYDGDDEEPEPAPAPQRVSGYDPPPANW